jgi:hypothetical protein
LEALRIFTSDDERGGKVGNHGLTPPSRISPITLNRALAFKGQNLHYGAGLFTKLRTTALDAFAEEQNQVLGDERFTYFSFMVFQLSPKAFVGPPEGEKSGRLSLFNGAYMQLFAVAGFSGWRGNTSVPVVAS